MSIAIIMRRVLSVFLRLNLALFLLSAPALPTAAQAAAYEAGFVRWRAADGGFRDWNIDGVRIATGGTLRLTRVTARTESDPYPAGGYRGRNYYNGGAYLVGEAHSPIAATSFAFSQAVVSWNAQTPSGTWIETQIRARIGEHWTKWYSLGVWAADTSTVARHSVDAQGDTDGTVDVDTLMLSPANGGANALQLKMRLFSADEIALPTLRSVAVAYSKNPVAAPGKIPGNPEQWGRILAVPECSQMVYPEGGDVWCSPTSTSMVLGYWMRGSDLCEPRVRSAVTGVYDWLYDGHGNWPFNAAYAATQAWHHRASQRGGRAWARSPIRRIPNPKLEAYVARLTSLAQAEDWIAAGVPIVVSVAWDYLALSGAPFPTSPGHLAVLVGFDGAGNPVVNDPGAPSNEAVQRTYLRGQFESAWLGHTGGTVYLIYPLGWPVPDL